MATFRMDTFRDEMVEHDASDDQIEVFSIACLSLFTRGEQNCVATKDSFLHDGKVAV